jgi:hypothetical protein
MNELDQGLLEDALETVKDVCEEPIPYTRFAYGEHDTEKGMTERMPETFPIYAIKNGFSLQSLGASFGAGSAVEAHDINVMAPASQFKHEPAIGDQLEFDGRVWIVKGKRAQHGAVAVIMWELQVRAEG